jgi:transcriptional regulator with XRE-family HTH domain
MSAVADAVPLGILLKDWRRRRRLSQLDLALEAGVSARHLSFVETGRSKPSREMVIHLAEQLEVPLRDRNHLLLAAGYAPAYGEHPLDAPEMAPVREAIDGVLAGHAPFPAVAVDRWWNLVAANEPLALLTDGVAPELMEPPVNALRVALHPGGMAPRILNLGQYRAHLLDRLRREVALTADERLAALHDELSAYPAPPAPPTPGHPEIAVALRLRVGERELAFFSTVATFGTALDITLAELAIEAFFPADAETAAYLRAYPADCVGGHG